MMKAPKATPEQVKIVETLAKLAAVFQPAKPTRQGLTEAERARLSQPFPRGRTAEQESADAALLGKAYAATKPQPRHSTIILTLKAWVVWAVILTVISGALIVLGW